MTRAEAQVARILSECADYPAAKITKSTQVYHDAGLSGDDLYDFAVRLQEELGIIFPGKLTAYAPPEGGISFGLPELLPWMFSRKPLTVATLASLASPPADAGSA